MLGRAAYQEPWRLLEVDPELFGEAAPHPTMKACAGSADPLHRSAARAGRAAACDHAPLIGAYQGVPGARAFRRYLSEFGVKPDADAQRAAEGDDRGRRRGRPRRGGVDPPVTDSRAAAAGRRGPPSFPAGRGSSCRADWSSSGRAAPRAPAPSARPACRSRCCRVTAWRRGCDRRRFRVDVEVEQFQRQAGGLRGLVGQHDRGRAGVDHHRRVDAVDLGAQREFAAGAARDLYDAVMRGGRRWPRRRASSASSTSRRRRRRSASDRHRRPPRPRSPISTTRTSRMRLTAHLVSVRAPLRGLGGSSPASAMRPGSAAMMAQRARRAPADASARSPAWSGRSRSTGSVSRVDQADRDAGRFDAHAGWWRTLGDFCKPHRYSPVPAFMIGLPRGRLLVVGLDRRRVAAAALRRPSAPAPTSPAPAGR